MCYGRQIDRTKSASIKFVDEVDSKSFVSTSKTNEPVVISVILVNEEQHFSAGSAGSLAS
jgi:hypothetical protein